jgi:hypothetical protein
MDPQLVNDAALDAPSPRGADSAITDDLSLETILRVSLEEAVARGEHIQGKAREGAPLTAEQLALQLHVAEVEAALQSILDSRFARGLERAVDEDAQMIQFFQESEEREREDRALAMDLSRPGSRMSILPAEAASPSPAVRVPGNWSPMRRPEVASASA